MNVLTRLGHEARLLQVALQYFTRLPVPSFAQFDPAWLSQSVRYFPVVGMVVGMIGAGVLLLCTHLLSMPIAIAALLALAATVIATGAFHEDGLADTFDALGGHVRRERALEIMRDSRIGTYGASALGMGLLLRWQAIAALPPWLAAVALVCSHAAARASAASLMATLAYVRLEDDAKAKPVAQDLRLSNLLATTVMGVLPGLICIAVFDTMRWPMMAGLAAIVVTRTGCAIWFRRRLGGYTGDALGCCEQLCEIAFLLAVVATTATLAR
jgi:adenosylcobinamide-GDP ribazoletransferase